MRGGGSRLEASGGNFTRRRRERYNRERRRPVPFWPEPDEPWEGDDDETGAER